MLTRVLTLVLLALLDCVVLVLVAEQTLSLQGALSLLPLASGLSGVLFSRVRTGQEAGAAPPPLLAELYEQEDEEELKVLETEAFIGNRHFSPDSLMALLTPLEIQDESSFMLTTNKKQSRAEEAIVENDSPTFRDIGVSDAISDTIRVQLEIHVFAWRRERSLRRLLVSLLRVPFSASMRIPVPLSIHVDGEPTKEVLRVIDDFKWPYGPLHIKRQETRQGLRKMILSAWRLESLDRIEKQDDSIRFHQGSAENDDNRYALFLEDDIEVSPFMLQWLQLYIRYFSKSADRLHLAGVSMYTPRVDELSPTSDPQHPPRFDARAFSLGNSSNSTNDFGMFLLQVPCSWGAMYRARTWRQFLHYYELRVDAKNFPSVPDSRSNIWLHSWKRYLIEFMYATGKVLLYPSLPNDESFSTNHYETGVHSAPVENASDTAPIHVPNVLREVKDLRFTVPLVQDERVISLLPNTFAKLSNMRIPVGNINHHPVGVLHAKDWLIKEADSTSRSESLKEVMMPLVGLRGEYGLQIKKWAPEIYDLLERFISSNES